MSIGVIAVIWGLVVPVCNIFYHAMTDDDKVKQARKEYMTAHPVLTIVGTIIGYAPIVAYWVFVITNLL